MSNTLEGSPHLTTEQKRALAKRLLREKAGVKGLSATLLPELFEVQVDRHPESIAITFEDQSATYRELDRRANQLAHRLRRLGVGPEVRVGLCVRRSIDMVVGLLGVLKAGGAYVPLDPDFPADRLALMLDDSRPSVLLTQEELRDTLPGTELSGTAVLCLDSDRRAFDRESDRRAGATAGAGEPGLRDLHVGLDRQAQGRAGRRTGALANFLESFHTLLGMTERDELLAVTTLSFDIAALELLLPLVAGGRLTLVARDEASDGARLKRRLADPGVTFLQATPATWRLLLEAGWDGKPGADAPLRRRGAAPRAGRSTAGQGQGALEPLRPDRDHDLVVGASGRAGHGSGLDRPADRPDAALRARCPASAGPGRRGRRAVHRRRPAWRVAI